MKNVWVTRRIHITAIDHKHYEDVKTHIIIPFVNKLKQDEGVKKWYWSTKGEDLDWEKTFPDIRIYVLVEEGDDDRIRRKFRALINTNKDLSFPSGTSPRSPVLLSKDMIKSTIAGSEDALGLLEKYPYRHIRQKSDSYNFAYFGALLRCINLNDTQRFHFIVNNLTSGGDIHTLEWLGDMCSFYKRNIDRWQGKRRIRDRLLYYVRLLKTKVTGEF